MEENANKLHFINFITSSFVVHPQILIFSVFKIASFSPYWLQIIFSMSLFFYLFTFAINLWHRKFVTADVTAVFVNNQHGIEDKILIKILFHLQWVRRKDSMHHSMWFVFDLSCICFLCFIQYACFSIAISFLANKGEYNIVKIHLSSWKVLQFILDKSLMGTLTIVRALQMQCQAKMALLTIIITVLCVLLMLADNLVGPE